MAREDFLNQEGTGGIRDFEFTVTDAYFAQSEKYNEKAGGEVLFLHWLGTTDLENFPTLGENDFHPSWKVGADWTTLDGGKTVTYSGKSKTPRMGGGQGGYGGLTGRVADLVPQGAEGAWLDEGHPSNAAIWLGTKWFMEEVTIQAGTQWEKKVLMPTQYLGRDGSPAPAATPSANAVAAPAQESSSLRDIVISIARDASSYQEFQAKALQLPNISADTSLIREVLDQNGIYAEAQG